MPEPPEMAVELPTPDQLQLQGMGLGSPMGSAHQPLAPNMISCQLPGQANHLAGPLGP